jgi:RND family efflux transporter MFP subunit
LTNEALIVSLKEVGRNSFFSFPQMGSRLEGRAKGLFLLCLIALLVVGCGTNGGTGDGKSGATAAKMEPRLVQTARTERRQLTQVVVAPGTLAADEQATVSFKVPGRLERLAIDLGSVVTRGGVLAQLETNDYQVRLQQTEAALQQARVRLGLPAIGDNDTVILESTSLVREAAAFLAEARQNRERTQQLVSQGILPAAELDRVESAYLVADSRYQDALEEGRNRQAILLQRRSELAIARQQLVETTLVAPFDGAIRERRASLGEFLAAGTPVATVVRLHPLRLRVEIPERDARGIRQGQPVKVTVDGDLTTYAGRVARLSPAFQEESRTLIIEAEVDNRDGRLRPGTFARAEIETSTLQTAIMVPSSSIITFAGIQKIFLIRDNKAIEQTVVVGRTEGNWKVVEGVEADVQIVLSPGNMVTGQPITVQP